MNDKQWPNKRCQLTWLVILRVAIGWHFLYEGVIKLLNPNWSSVGYLLDSKGIFTSFFQSLAVSSNIVNVVDLMNQWGLVLIGLGLILGGLTRIACYSGMLLLAFYYLSHPPFVGIKFDMPLEGNYLLVDKVLIEFCVLGFLSIFPTGKYIGIDRFFLKNKTDY